MAKTGNRAMVGTNVLRKRDVVRRTGLSDTTIWRLEKADQFPSRVRITDTRVGWFENEVDAWISDRIRGAGKRPLASPRQKIPSGKTG